MAVALSVGSYGLKLHAQRQLMISQRYQLARASQNAENGLIWARRAWLNVRMQASSPVLPIKLQWDVSGGGSDRADINITKGTSEWKVESIGYFGQARRFLNAVLSDPLIGEPMPLAISRRLYGNGQVVVSAAVSLVSIDKSLVTAATLSIPEKSEVISQVGLRSLPTIPPNTIIGDYTELGDGDPIALLTLPKQNGSEYGGVEAEHILTCQGTLTIGNDPQQLLVLEQGRLILRASRIVLQGQLVVPEGHSAEIWLIADEEIAWHSSSTRAASACFVWTSGTARFMGLQRTVWALSAVWAKDVELHDAELRVDGDRMSLLPEAWYPLGFKLPSLRKWHYKDMLRT